MEKSSAIITGAIVTILLLMIAWAGINKECIAAKETITVLQKQNRKLVRVVRVQSHELGISNEKMIEWMGVK